MESTHSNVAKLEFPADKDDFNYLSRLSTILVATIQEVKDQVFQLEFIFCSQLFPNMQSRLKLSERRLDDAKKAAEDEWKTKEVSLLNQIEELLLEKQHAEEQIQLLTSTLEENKMRLMSAQLSVKEHEHEKRQFMDKLEGLVGNEGIIAKFNKQLEQKNAEMTEGEAMQKRLLEQAEFKDQMLSIEQAKRRDLFNDFNKLKASYKQLKSQYLFLFRKISDSKNEHDLERMEQEKELPMPCPCKGSLQNADGKDQETTKHVPKPRLLASVILRNEKSVANPDIRSFKRSSPDPDIDQLSSSGSFLPKQNAGNAKSESLAGPKRISSCWRETRARQGAQDGDPHDDFFDTPMEIVRKLNEGPCEEAQDIAGPVPLDLDFNNSDDETQDVNTKSVLQQQQISSLGRPAIKGFKYVEPVRKKAERETLKGAQCLQCKKFYDAILHDGGKKSDIHCEHHDGVSRHRYRYAPPMTPEGFWNIGFDSEL